MFDSIKLYIDKIINVLAVLVFCGGIIGTIYCAYQGYDYIDDNLYLIAFIVFASTLVTSTFMIGFSELIANTREIMINNRNTKE